MRPNELPVAVAEPPAASNTSPPGLQRTASKALRSKRYRYQLNDLPPPPPPPVASLPLPPPVPQQQPWPFPPATHNRTAFPQLQGTGASPPPLLPPLPLLLHSQTSSPDGAAAAFAPARPPRSTSRPPPLTLVIPGAAEDAFDFRLPKELRRRSRSIGPTAAPFIRGHRRTGPTVAHVGPTAVTQEPHGRADAHAGVRVATRDGEDERSVAAASTDVSMMSTAQYAPPASREESLRALRRMSRTVAQLAVRPLPPPPSMTTATTSSAATATEASQSRSQFHSQHQHQHRTPNLPPAAGGAALQSSSGHSKGRHTEQERRGDDVPQFPTLRSGIKRISRSFSNLRAMYALDALQTEDRASKALDNVDRNRANQPLERTGRSRTTKPMPLDLSKATPTNSHYGAQGGALQPRPPPTDSSLRPTKSPRGAAFATASPSPPLSPPAGSIRASVRRDSTVSITGGGSRVLSAAAMYRMKAMSTAALAGSSRPAASNFPTLAVKRPGMDVASTASSGSSKLSTGSSAFRRPLHAASSSVSLASSYTATSSHSHSHSHSASRSLGASLPEKEKKRTYLDRVAPATRKTPDLDVVVQSPVDPVAAPGGRISFLKQKTEKPYMGERF